MSLRRLLYGGAWLTVAGVAVLVSTSVAAGASPASDRCGALGPSMASPAPAEVSGVPLIVDDPEAGIRFSLAFGDSRRRETEWVTLEASTREVTRNELIPRLGSTQNLRGPDGNELSARRDGVKTTVEVVGQQLEICFEVDPSAIKKFRPGRYTGTIALIDADEVPKAAVPVEVTFSESRWKALLIAFLGVLLGIAVKVLSEAAALHRAQGVGALQALRAYVAQLSFPVTLILGGIAGWIGYVHLYSADPDWGAGSTDTVKLFAACFVVQMSSSEAMSLLSRVAGGPAAAPAATDS